MSRDRVEYIKVAPKRGEQKRYSAQISEREVGHVFMRRIRVRKGSFELWSFTLPDEASLSEELTASRTAYPTMALVMSAFEKALASPEESSPEMTWAELFHWPARGDSLTSGEAAFLQDRARRAVLETAFRWEDSEADSDLNELREAVARAKLLGVMP